ncbi:hypothetical protein QBC38DRAFT_443384 [Podospora fimiseda]|uniref:Uncharacterized protein n=1 Tax=Podospora fimiseda TaxID=252190 RepID=A0AAN7BRI4_9PEZI|nr:hypothetical protein QBC38DRAFT_443384 [Podospora fimiseda]
MSQSRRAENVDCRIALPGSFQAVVNLREMRKVLKSDQQRAMTWDRIESQNSSKSHGLAGVCRPLIHWNAAESRFHGPAAVQNGPSGPGQIEMGTRLNFGDTQNHRLGPGHIVSADMLITPVMIFVMSFFLSFGLLTNLVRRNTQQMRKPTPQIPVTSSIVDMICSFCSSLDCQKIIGVQNLNGAKETSGRQVVNQAQSQSRTAAGGCWWESRYDNKNAMRVLHATATMDNMLQLMNTPWFGFQIIISNRFGYRGFTKSAQSGIKRS